jgi:hypothetical protein
MKNFTIQQNVMSCWQQPQTFCAYPVMHQGAMSTCVAILNKQKCHFFFLLQNQRTRYRTGPAWGNWFQWGRGEGGERAWEHNYYVHMYVNGKMVPFETIPGIGRGENKGEWWNGWIQVWYIWDMIRTFLNTTMYPHPTQ